MKAKEALVFEQTVMCRKCRRPVVLRAAPGESAVSVILFWRRDLDQTCPECRKQEVTA